MEKELITGMYYQTDIYDDYFIISIKATTNFKEEVIKRIEEKLRDLSINEMDLTRKKNATLATLILDYEDVEVVNMKIQDDILNNNGIVTNYKEMLESINEDDLENIIDRLNLDNTSITVFMPKENQES